MGIAKSRALRPIARLGERTLGGSPVIASIKVLVVNCVRSPLARQGPAGVST